MPFTIEPGHWAPRFEARLAPTLDSADPAHDLAHVRRVVVNAFRLAQAEGALLEIVLPAAWLHDCVVIPKDSPRRAHASREAARSAAEFLRGAGYPTEYLDDIRHAIEAHSFSAAIRPRTLEAMVVQDADRLDAMGAVGIARCLMLGGALGSELYHAEEPIPIDREPEDSRFVIDHFFTKLLGLRGTMQTKTGREEARLRVTFMRAFLSQLGGEVEEDLAGRFERNNQPA